MSSDLILVGWFDEDLLEAAPTGIQVGVDGKAAIDFALGLTRDSMTNVDALSSLMTDRFASQDWLIASARDNLLSIDFLLTVNRDGRIDIDWQGAVSILRDGNSPVDWMTFFDKVNASGIDWRIELGRDSGNSIDVLFGNGRGLQTAADFLSALQKDLGVPISWQMTVTFDASPASVDWRVLTDTLLLSRLDWRLLLGTDGALSIGVLSMGGVDARGALDFLSTLQRDVLQAIDWQGLPPIGIDMLMQMDWLKVSNRKVTVQVDASSLVDNEKGIPASWTELVDTLTRLGFDYETLVDEDGNIAVVWSEAVLEFLQPIYAVVVANRIFKIAGDSIAVTTGMRTSAVFADPIEPIVAMKTARVTNLEP